MWLSQKHLQDQMLEVNLDLSLTGSKLSLHLNNCYQWA